MNAIDQTPDYDDNGFPEEPNTSAHRQSMFHRIEFGLACLVTFFAPINYFRLEFMYFTVSDAFTLLFCLVALFNRSLPAIRVGAAATMWFIGTAMLMVFLLASSALHGDPESGLVVAAQYFFAYLLLPFVFFTRSQKELLILTKVLCVSVFVICMHGIYHIHIVGETNTEFVTGTGRLEALIGRPNASAALIAMTMPLLLYLRSLKEVSAITFVVCTLIYTYTVALTGSNSGFFGLIFGLAVYVAVSMNMRLILTSAAAVIAIVAVSIGYGDLFLPESFRERVLVTFVSGDISQAGTYSDRVDIALEALEFANQSLFLGLGADQFGVHSSHGYPVHNTYLLIWSEGGFPAVLGFALILLSATYVSLRTYQVRGSNSVFAASISIVLLFAVFINSATHVYGRFWVIPLLLSTALAWRFQVSNFRTPTPNVANIHQLNGKRNQVHG